MATVSETTEEAPITAPLQTRKNLLDCDLPALQEFLVTWGEKPFRAIQIIKWIHQRLVSDFSEMTDLSKSLREKLQTFCEIQAPAFVKEEISSDQTIKWLVQVAGGNHVEAVFIPDKGRGTLCVSSQVGCALNCSFCSTATQGFNRNLTTAEIIGQVWLAQKRLRALSETHEFPRLSNVVMMGMGEPMLNLDAVESAMSLMLSDHAYGLASRRVTLSTSGVIPGIDQLAESKRVTVALALSLHAPNDALRDQLVPINKKYPLKDLMAACRRYLQHHPKQRITMEYVMLKGINDQPEHARELVQLLRRANVPCKVNLIPFNTFFGTRYVCSGDDALDQFRKIVLEGDFVCTTRKRRGDDVKGACGQLVGEFKDRTHRRERFLKQTQQVVFPVAIQS